MKNPQDYIGSPLNKSASKQTYTFSKSKRFSKTKLVTETQYNLPSMFSKRTCSFGYGNKTDITNRSFSPPPNKYALPTFLTDKRRSITISQGRQKVQFGSYLIHLKQKKKQPSPLAYCPKVKYSQKGGKMAIKLPGELDILQKKQVPGPGKYQLTATEMNQTGSYHLSNYKNTYNTKYHPDSGIKKTKMSLIPHCYYFNDNKQDGIYVQSKYKSIYGSIFGKAKRTLQVDKDAKNTPPSKYRSFSQFGGNIKC